MYAKIHKKRISVSLTQILLFPRYDIYVTPTYPKGYDLLNWAVEEARQNALDNGGSFRITNDMMKLACPNVYCIQVLPADRGNEAENRLHTTKAVMAITTGDK